MAKSLIKEQTMFGKNTNEIQKYTQKYMHLILNEQETDDNCKQLKEILANLDGYNLGYQIKIPGPKCPVQERENYLLRAISGENFGRDLVINLIPAALAIHYGKGKFFEILIDAYPPVICLTRCNSTEKELDSPLICAIGNRDLGLVRTVLSNVNFVDHEFKEPKTHKPYVQHCINYSQFIENADALTMLKGVLEVRIPLIYAMSQNKLDEMRTLFMSISFAQYEKTHKQEFITIVKDCIKCARRLCNKPDATVQLLQASIS